MKWHSCSNRICLSDAPAWTSDRERRIYARARTVTGERITVSAKAFNE
jgi:hypothetical protein